MQCCTTCAGRNAGTSSAQVHAHKQYMLRDLQDSKVSGWQCAAARNRYQKITAGYGQWLKHRVASSFDRLQNSSARGMKFSLQHSAAVLSVLLVVMYFVLPQGIDFLRGRKLQQTSEGLPTTGSAWSMPRMCASTMLLRCYWTARCLLNSCQSHVRCNLLVISSLRFHL